MDPFVSKIFLALFFSSLVWAQGLQLANVGWFAKGEGVRAAPKKIKKGEPMPMVPSQKVAPKAEVSSEMNVEDMWMPASPVIQKVAKPSPRVVVKPVPTPKKPNVVPKVVPKVVIVPPKVTKPIPIAVKPPPVSKPPVVVKAKPVPLIPKIEVIQSPPPLLPQAPVDSEPIPPPVTDSKPTEESDPFAALEEAKAKKEMKKVADAPKSIQPILLQPATLPVPAVVEIPKPAAPEPERAPASVNLYEAVCSCGCLTHLAGDPKAPSTALFRDSECQIPMWDVRGLTPTSCTEMNGSSYCDQPFTKFGAECKPMEEMGTLANCIFKVIPLRGS